MSKKTSFALEKLAAIYAGLKKKNKPFNGRQRFLVIKSGILILYNNILQLQVYSTDF
jgi:hypothetical protein